MRQQAGVSFGPGKQQGGGAEVERVVLPGGPGEVPGVDGEIGGQLYDVFLPGGVAEGQVHGPVDGSGLRHRRVRLLGRGGQQARPRRRVIAHEVALEQVAGLPDGQAFQQRRHPRGTNVGTLLPGGGDVLVSHSATSRASAGLDTP